MSYRNEGRGERVVTEKRTRKFALWYEFYNMKIERSTADKMRNRAVVLEAAIIFFFKPQWEQQWPVTPPFIHCKPS